MIKAIVTGHSSGLGAALAQTLLARGIPVLGLSRRANTDLGASRLTQYAIDLSAAGALEGWLAGPELGDFVKDADTALLINNAGQLQPVAPCGAQAPARIAAAIQLNLTTPLLLANAFVARTGGCRERRIVHISSGAARNPYAGWSVYGATKAGLDQHARAVAQERIPGLRIASLAPGVVDTPMQGEVRASDPADFPQHARFAALKQDGQLTPPAEAARRLVEHLLGERFGEWVDGDLRSLPAA